MYEFRNISRCFPSVCFPQQNFSPCFPLPLKYYCVSLFWPTSSSCPLPPFHISLSSVTSSFLPFLLKNPPHPFHTKHNNVSVIRSAFYIFKAYSSYLTVPIWILLCLLAIQIQILFISNTLSLVFISFLKYLSITFFKYFFITFPYLSPSFPHTVNCPLPFLPAKKETILLIQGSMVLKRVEHLIK